MTKWTDTEIIKRIAAEIRCYYLNHKKPDNTDLAEHIFRALDRESGRAFQVAHMGHLFYELSGLSCGSRQYR
jgi:hypothetical protein